MMKERFVELDNFRGPLDLLLHLVREQELEITEVSLASVCDQYLAAVAEMRQLDIDLASEFLVVAATLMLIKSRQVLPREEVDLAEELDTEDPLIQQLLEYRRFKSLSLELARRADDRKRRAPRGANEVPEPDDPPLEDVSVWDLASTFARLVEEIGLQRGWDALTPQKPLREYTAQVVDKLSLKPRWRFRELVTALAEREGLLGFFLALLELVKTGEVAVVQEDPDADIELWLRTDRDKPRPAGVLGALVGRGDPPPLEASGGASMVAPPPAP